MAGSDPALHPPASRAALTTYAACVAGELALINLGSRVLSRTGADDLRPAMIAAAVGLHFLPFAWAFSERMFRWLGGLVGALGLAGMVAGAFLDAPVPEAAAVLAGLSMLAFVTAYASGQFAPGR